MVDVKDLVLDERNKKIDELIYCIWVDDIWVFNIQETEEHLTPKIINDLKYLIGYVKDQMGMNIIPEFQVFSDEAGEFVDFDITKVL